MYKFKRILSVLLAVVLVFGSMVTVGASIPQEDDYDIITSYTEIPDITPEEIQAVQTLLSSRNRFVMGIEFSNEAFFDSSGNVAGYDALICEWLSMLFDAKFQPKIYAKEDIPSALESGMIDFTTIPVTAESKNNYYITDPIAERSVKYIRMDTGKSPSEILYNKGLRFGYPANSALRAQVEAFIGSGSGAVFLSDYAEAYELLKNGSIDAFFLESSQETGFDNYNDVIAEDLTPLSAGKVALAAKNDELAPLIIVLQKALRSGGSYHLIRLFERGQEIYKRYKLQNLLTSSERVYLQNQMKTGKPIRVVMDKDNYPVSFFDKNAADWYGKSLDVLAELESVTGLTFIRINNEDSVQADLAQMVESGEADMLIGPDMSVDAKSAFLWSEPFEKGSYVLVSKMDYPDKNVNEVMFAKLGVVMNSKMAEVLLRWYPNHKNITLYMNFDEAVRALSSGDIDLLMATDDLMLKIAHYWGMTNYKTNVVFNGNYSSSFAFSKKEDKLCSIISKSLRFVDMNGISERWENRSPNSGDALSGKWVPILAGASAIFFLLVVFAFIFWYRERGRNKKLERTIRRREKELAGQSESGEGAASAAGDTAAISIVGDKAGIEAYLGMRLDGNRAETAITGISETKADTAGVSIGGDLAGMGIDGFKADIAGTIINITKPIGGDDISGAMLSADGYIYSAKTGKAEKGMPRAELLARLSDDFRLPLNTITGMTRIAKKAPNMEKMKSSVAEIEVAAENLTAILNNVLDMSRLESGTFVLEQETFHLKRLVLDVVEDYRAFCDEKGIGLSCELGDADDDWLVISDKQRLRQVLANTVGTMVRFSQNGHVLLLMSAGIEDNVLTAYFSVSDSESEVTADYAGEILELPEGEDIGVGRFGGADLSLVVIKHLVKRMGGELIVESVQEGGVRFAFSVLLALTDPEETGKDVSVIDTEQQAEVRFDKKLLFCDDVEINRMIFAELFMDTAMIIDEAGDGIQAVNYFANSPKDYYDIIFMDVKMPGVDGYEAVRRIRALNRGDAGSIPVVMMMTSENQEETEMAEALGATDHLIKPVDINAVMRMLSKHVK